MSSSGRGDTSRFNVAVPADYVANLSGGLNALIARISPAGSAGAVSRSRTILLTNPDPTSPNAPFDVPVSDTVTLDWTSPKIQGMGAGTTLTWTGPAGHDMFQVLDSSRVNLSDMTLLAGTGNAPGAAVHSYASGPAASQNEHLLIERVNIGRRFDTEPAYPVSFTYGVVWDGVIGNNDQFSLRDVTVHDCTSAGIYIGNEQAVWGQLSNIFLNSCAVGVNARGCFTASNLTFNRCPIDLSMDNGRGVIHGVWSEHSGLPFKILSTNSGAHLTIIGGRVSLMSDLTSTTWADLTLKGAGGAGFAAFGLHVDDQLAGSRTTQLVASGSSSDTNPASIYARGCTFPNGDSDAGYKITGYASGTPITVDVEQGSYRRRQVVQSTNPGSYVAPTAARNMIGPFWTSSSTPANTTNGRTLNSTIGGSRRMTSPGRVTGFVVNSNQACTAGTCNVFIVKNGVPQGSAAVLITTANPTGATLSWTMDNAPVSFVAGDQLAIWFTTSSDWLPTGASLTCEIEAVF